MIYTKKHNRITSRATAVVLTIVMLLLIVVVALADYVGTGSVQISLDPASVPAVADGLVVGDEISYILQQVPKDTGSTHGMNAYGTAYVPAGVEVVNAELVVLNGGIYTAVPAEDVRAAYNTCGKRTCRFPTTEAPNTADGKINEVQSDTGIFYSTDARTALVPAGYGTVDPTGSKVTPQTVYNQWDFDQVEAFGEDTSLVNQDEKPGQGNTPLVPHPTDVGVWIGTGAPVAGPDTYYTNDYNPDCNPNAVVEDDLKCVGPWQRIKYTNAKIGGSGAVTVAGEGDADPGDITNNAVATAAGHDFAGGALPAGTNALRYVFGARTLGDIELARITFKITDVSAFTTSIEAGEFCMDGTGGDTDKSSNVGGNKDAPKDNNWRYYESNNHTCYDGNGNAGIVKDPTHVNGNPISGNQVNAGDIVSYEMTFYNITPMALQDVMITDTAGDKIKLIEPGNAQCEYGSYDGDRPGNTPPYTTSSITGSSGASATWDTLATLPANSQVTVHVCGIVQTGLEGDEVLNNVCAVYDVPGGAQDVEVCDNTILLITLDPTAVTLDSLSANGSDLTLLVISMSFALLLTAAVVFSSRRRSIVSLDNR